MSDAVSCTVLRTCRIANSSSSEVSIEEEEDARLIEAATGRGRGRGRGVRLVKSTDDTSPDDVEGITRLEEPAVEPEEGFAAFDGIGSSTSIAASALRFDRRTGVFNGTIATAGVASTMAAAEEAAGRGGGASPSLQTTRTWKHRTHFGVSRSRPVLRS